MTIMTIVVDDAALGVEKNQATETQENVVPETEVVEASIEETTESTEPVKEEYKAPDKYAGKTLEDVISMHQNSESLIGKQGQELGEQRKLVQSLIEAQNATQTTTPPEEKTSFEDQFYSDPAQAVNSAIENHPEVVNARKERQQVQQQHQLSVLENAYPDWQERVSTKDFQDWVGSSEIRTEMFRKADSDYRPDYAIELFDMYDKLNMIDKTQVVKKEESKKRQDALKKTSSETRSSGDSIGGKKIYRRADLINLQVSDPNRYASLSDEIHSAYAEGRVK